MRRARHHTFQKPGWWLGRMTLRVVTAWSDLSIFDWESRTSPVRVLTPPVTRWGRRVVSNHALLSFRTATRRAPAGLPAPFGGPAPLAKRRCRFSRTRRRGSTTLAVSCAGCVAATWCPRRSCDCPFRGSRAFVRAVPRPSRRGSTARGFALVVSHVGWSHSVSGTFRSPSLDPRRLGMARPPPGLREVEGLEHALRRSFEPSGAHRSGSTLFTCDVCATRSWVAH
jgi:hypothetical protein